jgi:hypothetical protein
MSIENNWFTYVHNCFSTLGVLGLIAFLLFSRGPTSKYWLSFIIDRFTLQVSLTPTQVQRRLVATIHPFTPEGSAPYAEQWVTTAAFQIDRLAKSRLISTHGEIWPHPEGALISITLRASVVWLPLLLFFLIFNPFAFCSPTSLALSGGLMLLLGIGYYYLCLAEARRAKSFLSNLLHAPGSDEVSLTLPDISDQEPLLYDDQVELEKSKDGLVLTYSSRLTGFNIFLLISIILIDGFLIFLARVIVAAGSNPGILLLFVVLPLYGSLVLLYYTLASWLNRMVITLTRQTLSVRYRPLPVYKSLTLPTAELRQLYPKRVIVMFYKGGSEAIVTYELRAILKNNQHIKLFEFDSPKEVLYVKQQIEAWLRLNGYVLEASPQ